MKVINCALMAVFLMSATATCWGDVIEDPLHGYCSSGCIDNGTNSPTTQNPITGFGFTISPGPNTGHLLIEVLVPNNEQTAGASYAITGDATATATLFSATAWTSGQLDTYLGLGASPTNPIGAFLPSTKLLDPGATGFAVYQADLGTMTLNDQPNPNVSPLLNIDAIPIGSYIVGFLFAIPGNCERDCVASWIATTNSGAIFETTDGGGGGGGGGGNPVPEPSSIVLLGSGLLAGCAALRKKLVRS